MRSIELKQYIEDRQNLFWYSPAPKSETVSDELLVEIILNYGSMDDIRKLFYVMNINNVAKIFFDSIKKSERRKNNYHELTINYFTLLFNRYASFNYPYPIKHDEIVKRFISMPSLITLSAMKAFALGRRTKWKDYVDLYFILKNYYSIKDISTEANIIFGDLFSEKLFREQMSFHEDINYSEPVEYLPGFEVSEKEIKDFLINKSLENF